MGFRPQTLVDEVEYGKEHVGFLLQTVDIEHGIVMDIDEISTGYHLLIDLMVIQGEN